MTNILKDISTYDINTHTPYPTLEFIKDKTGEDVQLNQGGTKEQAQALVRQVTDACYNILKDSKDTLDTINRLEYKIATDETYRYAFIDYVATAVYAMYNFGADFLYKDEGKKGLDRLPLMVKSKVQSSVLAVGKFLYFTYDYRVGY